MSEGVCITRKLKSTHKDYKVVPLGKVGALLERHHDCYEMTLPIVDTDGTVLVEGTNRPYFDVEGYAPLEWDTIAFDNFVETVFESIQFALRDYPISVQSASQHGAIEKDKEQTRTVNKLSFHLVILNKHGSREAIKLLAKDVVFDLMEKSITDCKVFHTDILPRTPELPYLNVDTTVYTKNRKIRCWNSTKDDEVRPFVSLTDGGVNDTLITYIPPNAERLPEPAPPAPPSVGTVSNDPVDVEESSDKTDLIREVLRHLHIKRVDVRDYWLRMGFVLHNEGCGIETWKETSKRSPKYEEGCCEKVWRTMSPRNLTQALLWLWLKEDNPEKYAELSNKRTDFWTLLRDPSHFACAQYFASCRPDQYLYHASMGWFQLRKTGAWQVFKAKEIPDGLTKDIWMTFGKVCREHIAKLNPTDENDAKKIAAARALAHSAGERTFVMSVIWALPSFYYDEDLPSKMDESRHLWAFSDKVVDLNTMEVRNIEPHDYVSITTGYPYPKDLNPDVRRQITATLRGIWENDDMVEFFLLTIALMLYGKNVAELFYFWKGKGGNGKGLLMSLLDRVFGFYYHVVPIQMFTFAADRKDATNDNLVNCKGKRLITSQEPEGEHKIQCGFIKEFSGGDKITVRGTYEKPITFVPQCAPIVQMNPGCLMTKADPIAIGRRLVVMPFPFQFKGADRYTGAPDERRANAELKDKISKSDEWRNEMIRMLLEAYTRLPANRSDLMKPQMVRDATEDYLNENNPLKTWLWAEYERCDEQDNKYWHQSSELREEFLRYARLEPSALSANKFAELMEMNGVTKRQQTNNFVGNVWNDTAEVWEQRPRKAGSYWIGLRRK